MNVTLVAMNAMYSHTSLSLRLLSKAAEGLPVQHVPLELHINMREEASLRKIFETNPDVVCFSCYIWNIRHILPLMRSVKRLLPDTRIVLGGPEVGYDPFAYLSAHPQIDAIVCGEGEISYRLLLLRYINGENGDGIPGVCTRQTKEDASCIGEPIALSDLVSAYTSVSVYDPSRIWYAETSRGCPFSCRFCLSSIQPGVRALAASEAASLLQWMASHGAKLVKLIDRTFNFDQARAIAIWKELLDTTGDCVFHFEIEPNLLNEETLRFLSSVPSGKFQFEIGIQSTNPETLSNISRRLRHDHVRYALRTLHRFGNIPVHLDIITGLPYEDYASFSKSFNDVFEMEPSVLQVGFLKLLRGSGLARDAARYGIKSMEDAPYEVLRTDFLRFEEILRLKDIAKTVDWYYNAGQYPATTSLLLQYGTPFTVFESVALCLRVMGAFDAPISQAKRLEALFLSGLSLLPEQDVKYLRDSIRFDGLLQGLPPAQAPTECQGDPDDSNILRQKYPQYFVGRAYRVARFSFDIPTLLTERRLVDRETILRICLKESAYLNLSAEQQDKNL